jgi:uncharacterized membrane protein
MNPFDLKTALLARHAQHVVVIHFPIALSISSFAFDVLAVLKRSRALAAAAYYTLMGAAITAPVAVVTGILAWQLALHGARLHGNLRLHLLLGSSCAVMICALAWWRRRHQQQEAEGLSLTYWALAALALILVGLTGHLGGILSGVEAPN